MIVNELSEDPAFDTAYFFFDNRDGQSDLQLHNKLIRCLISQFGDMQQRNIPPELENAYKKSKSQQLLDKNLEKILSSILSRLSHAYIIIDALDECIEREKTLNWLSKIVQETSQTIHILVTSRPLPDIETAFTSLNLALVNIGEKAVNSDIAKYLNVQIESKFKKINDSNFKAEIKSILTEKAEGS